MNIAVYCRVSSKGQEDNTSLDNQEERGRAFCESKGFNPIVFRDASTGANMDRQAFTSMWEMMKVGEVQGVWFWRTDRLLRDLGIFHQFVLHTERTKCRLWIDGSEVDVREVSGYSRMAYESVGATVEKLSIALRTSEGRRKRFEEGTLWIGAVPLGYKREKGKGISIVKEDADIVRDIFRVFNLKTISKYEDVAEHVNKHLLPGSKKISKYIIPRLLRNKVYIGEKVFNTKLGNYTYHSEPIISMDTWLATQEKMRQNKKFRGKRTLLYPLEGMVHCYDCGRPLWVVGLKNAKGKDFRYYNCTSYTPKSLTKYNDYTDVKCNANTKNRISVDKLENGLWDILFDILSNSKVIEQDYKKQYESNKELRNSHKGKKVYYEKLIEKKEEANDKLALNLAEGIIDKYRYKRTLKTNNIEIDKIKKKLDDVLVEYNKFSKQIKIKDYMSMMQSDLSRKQSIQRKEDRKVFFRKYIKRVYVKLEKAESKNNKSYLVYVDLHISNANTTYTLNVSGIQYDIRIEKNSNKPKIVGYNYDFLIYNIYPFNSFIINKLAFSKVS